MTKSLEERVAELERRTQVTFGDFLLSLFVFMPLTGIAAIVLIVTVEVVFPTVEWVQDNQMTEQQRIEARDVFWDRLWNGRKKVSK